MLNVKRIQDLNQVDDLSANQNANYVEITRYSGAGLYHTYRISMYNFLRSLGERLTSVKLSDQVQYTQKNVMLGTVVYSATQMSDQNYIIADGGFYTDNKNAKFHNVTFVSHLTKFVDFTRQMFSSGCGSIISADIKEFYKYTEDVNNNGRFICDFTNRIMRVPNLNTMYVKSTCDLSKTGTREHASLPNISGFFSSCYHGFDQSAKKYERLIQNISKLTEGSFTIREGKVDKGYVTADLDLSNQSEKFAWSIDIGQLVDFDASRMSQVYGSNDNDVTPDSVRLIPYILINNVFTLNREAKFSGE